MERAGLYPIDYTFEVLRTRDKYVNFDGYLVKARSQRYAVFRKQLSCVCCGLRPQFFALERTEGVDTYHLNLYSIQDGKEVLFTKDHILPRSKGGKDKIWNYQTMCIKCNNKKGKEFETMDKFTIDEIRNYLKAQDSFGDALYNLNCENIRKANDGKNDEPGATYGDYIDNEEEY
jgi:hypothetical protein